MTNTSSSSRREKCKCKCHTYRRASAPILGCKVCNCFKANETPPSQKKQQDCCQCYCEKCRDCYRQPCKIHKPSHYTGTPATTSTGTYFPSQKKDTRTYEETLETVGKLSKLMQKEGWENDLDGLLCSYKVLDQETFFGIITRFIKSLLKVERERIKKEMLEVIEKV